MLFSTGADDRSPPTSPVNTRTTAPLPSTSGQASGTPPIAGEGPSATPVGTAKYWACGQGLKQAHNLSSFQLAAFAVGPAGNKGCWFVTIRGTDQQISEALVVIGKCITKRRVRAPQKQKTGNSAPKVAALAPSPSDSDSAPSTPQPSTQLTRPPCSTPSHLAATPATQATPLSLLAGSPMVTGSSTVTRPLASGSLMDTMLPMALSTPTSASDITLGLTRGHAALTQPNALDLSGVVINTVH
ncbi:hypothetical protein C0995_009477 [Termitomyces sp. Mi166|nr:hypothetical protein C0995_009477 [Termitomyces sp. Mi166\